MRFDPRRECEMHCFGCLELPIFEDLGTRCERPCAEAIGPSLWLACDPLRKMFFKDRIDLYSLVIF